MKTFFEPIEVPCDIPSHVYIVGIYKPNPKFNPTTPCFFRLEVDGITLSNGKLAQRAKDGRYFVAGPSKQGKIYGKMAWIPHWKLDKSLGDAVCKVVLAYMGIEQVGEEDKDVAATES